jgi:hypothetical protein
MVCSTEKGMTRQAPYDKVPGVSNVARRGARAPKKQNRMRRFGRSSGLFVPSAVLCRAGD